MSGFRHALLFLLVWPLAAQAQSGDSPATNVAILSQLAEECLPDTGPLDTIALAAPSRLPFLRSALVSALRDRGLTVVAEPADDTPALEVDLQRANVSYARRGGGEVLRTVSLSVAVQLLGARGDILHDSLCTPSSEDRVPRDLIPQLEETAYPETQGTVPLSIWRRAIQPAVITLATAAGTVLFFSLRSRRTDGS